MSQRSHSRQSMCGCAHLDIRDGVNDPADCQEVRVLRQEAVLDDAPPMGDRLRQLGT